MRTDRMHHQPDTEIHIRTHVDAERWRDELSKLAASDRPSDVVRAGRIREALNLYRQHAGHGGPGAGAR